MIGALVFLLCGFAWVGLLALIGHRHNRRYDSARAEHDRA